MIEAGGLIPTTLAQAEKGGVPPSRPTTVGTGEEEPEAGDAELFWALHNRSVEDFPGLDEILQKHGLPPLPLNYRVSEVGLARFLDEAYEEGLIKKRRPLTLRQYIGALLP